MRLILPPNNSFLRHFARVAACFLLLFCTSALWAQKQDAPEEISLLVTVPRVGSTELPALIQNEKAFVSITGLFDYLKIKNRITPDLDSVSGFFLKQEATYTISQRRQKIFYGERFFTLQPRSLLRTDTDLYLRSDYFGKIFGLELEFDFRSLSITVRTKLELPVLRELQQDAMRRNIGQLKGERKADTIFGREFPIFRAGFADWQISSGQLPNGNVDTRVSLALGTAALGGEANVNVLLSPGQPFDERLLLYRWRYVNNENKLLRQVSVGKIMPEVTSTLTSSVRGIQLTNTPVTYRKSFGTYTLSNRTEPGWVVELYVNNILVNYTKADASGFYTFEVPMVYGQSNVKLRFYGPWGEEKTKEEQVVIPFSFVPERKLEYTLTAGVVKEIKQEQFARFNARYGVSRFFTLGGGLEYYTAVGSGRYMPYVTAALRVFSNVVFYGEHTYGVRSKWLLNYRHPSNLQIDVNYTRYEPGQKAVRLQDERKIVLSKPFRGRKMTAFSRLTFSQLDDVKKNLSNTELLVSTFYSFISCNFITQAVLNQPDPLIRSNLSLTFRLPWRTRFTQQAQYEYARKSVSTYRAELEKGIFRAGYLNLSFERNVPAKTNSINLGLRFNFAGLQAAFFGSRSREAFTLYESLRGSLLYDHNSRRLQFDNQSNTGRGGITIVPFLDMNGNGRKESDEPKVCGLKVKMNGGRLTHCTRDTTIQVTGLEAYANYFLEIDKNSFDNVAWQIKKPVVNIVVDANYFKTVEVPVSVLGEVEGTVLLQSAEGTKGQGRLLVRFFKNGKQVARVMTEADGYFNFMGFTPGEYTAEIDSEQLKKVGLAATPASLSFSIGSNKEGDLIRGLKFVVQKVATEAARQ